jgi:hypothetical protein
MNNLLEPLFLAVSVFLVLRVLYYFSSEIENILFGGTNCNPKG